MAATEGLTTSSSWLRAVDTFVGSSPSKWGIDYSRVNPQKLLINWMIQCTSACTHVIVQPVFLRRCF